MILTNLDLFRFQTNTAGVGRHYFGGYRPIDYRHSSADTMDPDNIVKIILTLAEVPMSEPSDSSESPFTDEDDTLRRIGWEDIQAKKPRWALLADTYAAATSTSKAVSAVSISCWSFDTYTR